MSTKNKKVTYKHRIDENTDYLVPLQYDCNSSIPMQSKLSEIPSPHPPSGFFASIYFPISLLLYVGVPISQLVIGFVYLGQCPVQQLIIIWMIVSGIAGILLAIIGLIIHMKFREPSFYNNPRFYPSIIRILLPMFLLILLFIIAWFFRWTSIYI